MSRAVLILLLCLAAFVLSLVLTRLVLAFARRALVDVPNQRSSHAVPTPRGGGVGFLAALFLTGSAARFLDPSFAAPDIRLLAALVLPLALVGFMDDWKSLPALIRLAAHVAVAAATAWAFAPDLATAAGGPALPWLAAAALILVAAVNITNFMDGMDGLVAGCLAACFAFMGMWAAEPLWWLLAAALMGFLHWNWSPARIFMGDVGSTALGGLLALAFLRHAAAPWIPSVAEPGTESGAGPQAAAWALGHCAMLLPIYGDGLYTLIRRGLRRENVLKAHHSHVYQRLMRSGLGHAPIARGYILLTLVLGLAADCFGPLGAAFGLGLCLGGLLWAERRISRARVPFNV